MSNTMFTKPSGVTVALPTCSSGAVRVSVPLVIWSEGGRGERGRGGEEREGGEWYTQTLL